jgi:[ribosomal protein S18]-alanine N-acetyltransferase
MNSANTEVPQNIRKAKLNDIDSIFKIEQKCFEGLTAYSRRHLKYLALKANSTCLVEIQGENLRGFIIVDCREGSLVGSIETIDVDPEYQNQGIGTKLLAAAEEEMRQQGITTSQLEVSEKNAFAIKLYKKAGYKLKERLREYYLYNHNGTRDALRLIKPLQ